MFIGAMLDLGIDAHQLEHELRKLPLRGYQLHTARGQKASISGVKFQVHVTDEEHDDNGGNHAHGHHHPHEPEPGHEHQQKHHEHSHAHEHHQHRSDHDHEQHHGRNFSEIKQLIAQSSLSDWVKQRSIAVFERIAIAEGRIHDVPAEQVHFHEVGAVDSIVD